MIPIIAALIKYRFVNNYINENQFNIIFDKNCKTKQLHVADIITHQFKSKISDINAMIKQKD